MRKIKFSKIHGQGNDFIIIDSVTAPFNLSGNAIAGMCDRHFGVGADGLILVKKSGKADFFMDYYNHDGTVAEMCGNGIRCMSAFITAKGLSDKKNIKIDTRAGVKDIEINPGEKPVGYAVKKNIINEAEAWNIKVDMGKPVFNPKEIPVDTGMHKTGFINKGKYRDGMIFDYPLHVCGIDFKINCVSMGNPHCVIFIDNNIDLQEIPVSGWGAAIENHPIFPNKTNVEFIQVHDGKELSMRVWERGVGETLACGTGACASAICSMFLNKIKTGQSTVNLPGGTLDIYWKGFNETVFLEGKVTWVFEGIYFIKSLQQELPGHDI